MINKYIFAGIVVALSPVHTFAGGVGFMGIDLGLNAAKIGDLGESFGVEAGYFIKPSLRARVSYSSFNYENQRVVGSISFTETMDQQNTRLTLDWFPWHQKNGLYGSLGITNLGDAATLSARADTTLIYPLDGNIYSGAQLGTINGTIKTKPNLPYVGVGYRHSFNQQTNRGLFFQAEVGTVFGLESELALESTNPSNIATLPASLQNYADQQNDKFEDQYTLYSLTVGYRF